MPAIFEFKSHSKNHKNFKPKVTISEIDFECPHCYFLHKNIKVKDIEQEFNCSDCEKTFRIFYEELDIKFIEMREFPREGSFGFR
jgi:transcription elongation factor Elf1